MAFLSFRPGHVFGGGPRLGTVWILLPVVSCGLIPCPTLAQNAPSSQPQAAVSVQGSRLSEGFFEYSGTSWTLIGPRGFVRFGSPSSAISPLASFGDPGAGLGMGIKAGHIQGQFFGHWGQQYRRSFMGQSLQITLPDGSWGSMGDQAYTPFVIGFFPVVGDAPLYPPLAPGLPVPADPFPLFATPGMFAPPSGISENTAAIRKPGEKNSNRDEKDGPSQPGLPNETPLGQDQNALVLSGKASEHSRDGASPAVISKSAERVVYGVDEARRRREQELARENEIARSYLSRAETALQSGKPEVAKTYLRLALQHASERLRDEVVSKLKSLEQPGKP
ncbi:MAG: DUF4398 domain-containing protein [Thermogutta sp.]|nr:DUF4398 domain-containing protein [Thermogutta sp.]